MDDKIRFVPKKIKIVELDNDNTFKFVVLEEGNEYHSEIKHSFNKFGKFPHTAVVGKEKIIGQAETPKRAIEMAEEAITMRRKEKADGRGKVIWEVDI